MGEYKLEKIEEKLRLGSLLLADYVDETKEIFDYEWPLSYFSDGHLNNDVLKRTIESLCIYAEGFSFDMFDEMDEVSKEAFVCDIGVCSLNVDRMSDELRTRFNNVNLIREIGTGREVFYFSISNFQNELEKKGYCLEFESDYDVLESSKNVRIRNLC